MKRLYLTFASALISVVMVNGQTLDDIELFNTRDLHGTPRYVGMGGAFSALGNDLSAIHLNPASSSVFRQDNFGLSLGFQTRSGDQGFYNGTSPSSDFSFLFENIGVVKKFEVGGYNNKSELAFSLGYTKLAEFNREYTVTADRTIGAYGEGSLANYWFQRELPDGSFDGAFDLSPDQLSNFGLFEELAASQAGLFYMPDDTIRDISLGNANASTNSKVSYTRDERGSFNEAHIGLAGAYKDVFHYGIALGFPTLSYINQDRITEYSLPTDTFPFDANSYTLNRTNDLYATGVNIKLGTIIKAAQWFRLGLSYESPSWYTVTQLYNIDVTAQFDNGDFLESDLLTTGEYSYKLRTPSIYRVGGAFIFGKQGLLSLDYEYSDPSQSRTYTNSGSYNVLEDDLQASNTTVTNVMTARQTFKAGGEYRLGPVMLRAGYSLRQSAYKNPDEFKSD
ncbi:MAG: hypothetical protein ACPF9D_08910, partial [Owenweeksia sp.]